MRTTHTRFMRLLSLVMLLSLVFCNTTWAMAAPSKPTWPSIRADSAIVIDADTGETLYEKNADSMMVPASMTKVMTAYIIFEELEAGNLTLDTKIPISSANAQRSRDAVNYPASVPLVAGSSLSVDTLLKLILLPSASASCVVMAEFISGTEAAFVARMNDTAKRLGMTANYQNCHGAKVHYITARSQAILVKAFIDRFPQILNYTSLTSMTFNGKTYSNTNKLLPGGAYAYEGATGFKTGTIAAAGYCLSASAERNGHRIISVIMHSDNDKTRHTDSQTILNYGFRILEDRAVFPDISYHWARESVETLYAKNVELNTEAGSPFRPDQAITRAEFTAMLYSALEQQHTLPEAPTETTDVQFTDISGHWAEDYITKSAALGLISGVGDGLFAPDTPINRQSMMVLIDRFLKFPDKNGLGFSDDGNIDFWALESAARVTAAGLFSGDDLNRLLPTKSASRAEAATVILRLLPLA